MTDVCENCGEPLLRQQKRFCSKSCYGKHLKDENNRTWFIKGTGGRTEYRTGTRSAIRDYILKHIADQVTEGTYWPPVFPTHRNIMTALDISSTSVVRYHLEVLEDLGILHHRPGHGYSLTQEAITLLPEEAAKHVRKLFKQE